MKKSILILAILGLGVSAEARTAHVPPLSSSFEVGGYNAEVSPNLYCERSGFLFREYLEGTTVAVNKLTHGAFGSITFALRNISAINQTVSIIFDNVEMEASRWKTDGKGLRDGYITKTFNNGKAGYIVKQTIGPHKSVVASFQYGCQGDAELNNCWLFAFPVVQDGVEIKSAQSIFGVLPLNDLAMTNALKKFLCYRLETVFDVRIVVDEKKGSVVGSVSSQGYAGAVETNVIKSIDYELNGGLPF